MKITLFKRNYGFSLTELMITITILSIAVSAGFPQYKKAILKSKERDAIVQLSVLHVANENFFITQKEYVDDEGGTLNAKDLNSKLSIKIIPNDSVYTYDRLSSSTYAATAQITGGSTFTLTLSQADLSSSNPCCSAGTCYIVDNCTP